MIIPTIKTNTAASTTALQSKSVPNKNSDTQQININGTLTTQTVVETAANVVKQGNVVQANTTTQITPPMIPASGPNALNGGTNDTLSVFTKQIQPYERVVGISQDRPTIIAVSDYQPFTTPAGAPTNAYQYFDAQSFLRFIRQQNIVRAVEIASTIDPNASKTTIVDNTQALIKNAQQQFKTNLTNLGKLADVLVSIIQGIDGLKNKLDIRDDSKSADVQNVINVYVHQYASQKSLEAFTLTAHPASYDITSILASLGYDINNIKSVYSCSKIWLQMMYELKQVLQTHSLSFIDAQTIDAALDSNPITITVNKTTRFLLENRQPNLMSLAILKEVTPNNITTTKAIIVDAYNNLYTNVQFGSSEVKIAALLNFVTKEMRYSRALADSNTQNNLKRNFNAVINDAGNQGLFDFVIGQFGTTALDFAANQNQSSLASIATRLTTDNQKVLTFEQKYVEGDNGLLTAGAAYFIDTLLETTGIKFNTDNLTALNNLFKDNANAFTVLVNQMGLIVDDPVPADPFHADGAHLMSNPVLLFMWLNRVVDANGKTLPIITNDAIASIFTLAAKDSNIKSLLFMYFVTKLSRSHNSSVPFFSIYSAVDNITTIQSIVDQLLNAVLTSVQSTSSIQTSTADVLKTVATTTIRNNLLSSSPLLFLTEYLLSTMIIQMQQNNAVVAVDKTRYGGYLDTALLMTFFDAIVTTIALLGKQEFVNKSLSVVDGNQLTYIQEITTSKTTKNHLNSITARLNKEIALTQELVFATLGTLQNITNATNSLLNIVNADAAINALSTVQKQLSNLQLLKFFMTRQQITLFANSVAQALTLSKTQSQQSLEILDENYVTAKLHNLIANFFQTSIINFGIGNKTAKKIITVGVPIGFVDRLHQVIDQRAITKNSFLNKERDIIRISIYKIDSENPHLVFKPQQFLFEMSRFVSWSDDTIKNNKKNVYDALGTIDLSEGFGLGGTAEYWPGTKGDKIAFSSPDYSFLNTAQRTEIHQNHIKSHLLSQYLMTLAGLSLDENSFEIKNNKFSCDTALLQKIVDKQIAAVVARSVINAGGTPKTGVLFPDVGQENTILTAGIPTINTPAALLAQQDYDMTIGMLATVNDMTQLATSLTNVDSYNAKLIAPKKFDRVFNILVDYNDFIIDYVKTTSTAVGKAAFAALQSAGKVVATSGAVDSYKFVIKTDADIVFDQYFAVIETFDESYLV